MTASFIQILEHERSQLLRESAELFEAASTHRYGTDPIEILTAANKLRKNITEALQSHAAEISKEEMINLQSSLHKTVDEQIEQALGKFYVRQLKALTEQAHRDSVTGLLNRTAFDERLSEEVSRARRYRRDLSVVLFDVDNFKSVNDKFGHQEGDRVLAGVAGLLQSSLRQSDAIFRFGGDEFIALCPETSGEAMKAFLQRFDANLQSNNPETGIARLTGISWGVASFPTDATEADTLIKIADDRLYSCKRKHHQKMVAS